MINKFKHVNINIQYTLIQRGGGTGPMKPGNHLTDLLKRC